jgi:hypothetical protein
MTLAIVAVVLFAVAAVGGLVMAVQRFRGRPQPPLALALVHGGLAAAGLVVLIAVVAKGGASLAVVSLVLFAVAALGGFYLFLGQHLRKKALSVPVVAVHAVVAVTAFVLLLVAVSGA